MGGTGFFSPSKGRRTPVAMGALYGYLHPAPVALYVAVYLAMATYYFFVYIIRRRVRLCSYNIARVAL
jgi:hypothetical protein